MLAVVGSMVRPSVQSYMTFCTLKYIYIYLHLLPLLLYPFIAFAFSHTPNLIPSGFIHALGNKHIIIDSSGCHSSVVGKKYKQESRWFQYNSPINSLVCGNCLRRFIHSVNE